MSRELEHLRRVGLDAQALDAAADAMYRIREPKGSQRLAFDRISPNKQARNRELAQSLLVSVIEMFPTPQGRTDAIALRKHVAEQMYRTLAPQKSEAFPFDQRSPHAHAYYESVALKFFENFLAPMIPQQRTVGLAGENDLHLPRTTTVRAVPAINRVPSTRASSSVSGAWSPDPILIEAAAAAMYRIREPKGSQRLSFKRISPNKQARNRELALALLRSVIDIFPTSQSRENSAVVRTHVAAQMYRTLAPRKSEEYPFDQRSPRAHAYYELLALSFFEDFLRPAMPATTDSDRAGSVAVSQPSATAALQQRLAKPAPLPTIPDLPPGTHSNTPPQLVSGAATPRVAANSSLPPEPKPEPKPEHEPESNPTATKLTAASPPARSSSTIAPPSPPASGPSAMLGCIAFLLFCILVLLFVLVIR